jgi:arylsulfatase A-like enzyme
VGRIIEVLKEEGLYENTVIIYASDHGDLLGDHGLVFKQSFYEQNIKVPLIINVPAMFRPKRIKDNIELIDIYSIGCELVNTWSGEGIQGKNLLVFLKRKKSYLHSKAIFSENWYGRMVKYQNYKMIYYLEKPYGEFYDLAKDPIEQYNLWEKLDVYKIKNKLKDLLLDWVFTSEDPLPLPVRLGHQDFTPPHMQLFNGRSVISDRQPWYLDDLITLYKE